MCHIRRNNKILYMVLHTFLLIFSFKQSIIGVYICKQYIACSTFVQNISQCHVYCFELKCMYLYEANTRRHPMRSHVLCCCSQVLIKSIFFFWSKCVHKQYISICRWHELWCGAVKFTSETPTKSDVIFWHIRQLERRVSLNNSIIKFLLFIVIFHSREFKKKNFLR